MKKTILIAVAPILWGTTYIVTTEFLPTYGPITVATIRALPIGLLLIFYYRIFPEGNWWWRSFVLGGLNIGLFFALLFVATYRLPGGIAATVGAIQPILVILFSWGLLKQRPQVMVLLVSLLGVIGVGLLVLAPTAQLDFVGVAAAIAGSMSMACGVVLTKYWQRPVPLIVFTSWQLVAGGLILLPLALYFEGAPIVWPNKENLLGFGWLAILNTGLGYALWFKGIEQLQAWKVSVLGLLSPVVAVGAGYFFLSQSMGYGQLIGAGLILSSIVLAQRLKTSEPTAVSKRPLTQMLPNSS